ncbi:MAG: hypothetical protein ACD_41C00207G0001 [uncultured bacterium]|nr:MAG: hypothetical protein ACD_41C00207G0001 [uncultured bacterium]HBY73532.1 hypothetical protein [Candidatus Kerfeldbacteria bacterium]
MGNLERNESGAFDYRVEAARKRAELALESDNLGEVLGGAMQLVGFAEDGAEPNPDTVAAWEAKLQ